MSLEQQIQLVTDAPHVLIPLLSLIAMAGFAVGRFLRESVAHRSETAALRAMLELADRKAAELKATADSLDEMKRALDRQEADIRSHRAWFDRLAKLGEKYLTSVDQRAHDQRLS